MFARGRMCVYGRYAPELCSFFLFSWSWLIPRVSRDFIDCDEFKWQRLLLDLFNRFVRTAMTKHYRQYRCSQRWCSIDIKTICLSFFFSAYFTREVATVCYANSTLNLVQSQSLGLIISGGQSVRMRHRSELTCYDLFICLFVCLFFFFYIKAFAIL